MAKGVPHKKKDSLNDGVYQRSICLNCTKLGGPETCIPTKSLCPLKQETAGRRREVYDFILRSPRTVDEITELLGTDANHSSEICYLLRKSSLIHRVNGKWAIKP